MRSYRAAFVIAGIGERLEGQGHMVLNSWYQAKHLHLLPGPGYGRDEDARGRNNAGFVSGLSRLEPSSASVLHKRWRFRGTSSARRRGGSTKGFVRICPSMQ